GVEPHAYLADVITRIVNDHPNSQIDELLPWALSRYPRTLARGLRTSLTLLR
ncbi:transposase domain-containing protein, partial [Bradyrhizobium sp. S3.2.12]|uniref:transposase domain-containing protein n=1 Tax=Bradyrhizobium sp. S3.2.12 TaxID=3156387 RepID=UPI0033931E13